VATTPGPGSAAGRAVDGLAEQVGYLLPQLVAGYLPGNRGLKVSSPGTDMGARSAAYEYLGEPMRISDVLRVKGTQVVTVTPDTTVRQLLAVLAEHRIGAVVVSHDGTTVDGIASERDIVQALARRGAAVMSDPVTAIYTAEVHTVTPQIPIEDVMRMMTERRVRHVPVVDDNRLLGIVSIGDVVKIRIGELETERTALTDYITGTR
jgi:CBS domain-containing protein